MPPSWRLIARRLVFLPEDVFTAPSRKGKMLPPRGMIFTGSGDFLEAGRRWLKIFRKYGLTPNSPFLDIGSGIGRMAVPLTTYLDASTSYEGFDIMSVGVAWCKRNISEKHPNFNFTLIDLHNDLYRSSGGDAASLKFPYDSDSFDMAGATSVFTHMLPDETYHYLEECHRVLKPGGKLVATFFLSEHFPVDDAAATIKFPHIYDGYALHSLKSKAANVCYDKNELCNKAEAMGYKVADVKLGHWRGTDKDQALDFQDIVVLEKT